jgi:hypothetical protein
LDRPGWVRLAVMGEREEPILDSAPPARAVAASHASDVAAIRALPEGALTPHHIVAMQRTAGNARVSQFLSGRRLARQHDVIEVELFVSRDEYRPPRGREVYRVGDAAAGRLLMDIQERGSDVVFLTFNFETGRAQEMSPDEWSFFRGAAVIGGSNAGITKLGRQLRPSEWRALWPDPMPELLRRYEAGQLAMDDEAVLTGYRGMIRTDASRSLDDNERAIDELLGAADRVRALQDYATGLREASVVRDALVRRRDEIAHSLVQQHSFTFGPPKTGTGPDMAQRLNLLNQQAAIDDTLTFWLAAFPLLTRLQTPQINSGSVEAKLVEIKANIVAARQQLSRGRLDPMELDTVRGRIAGRLGPKTSGVVAAEDKSRSRWAMAGAAATTAATIAILFLPGGVFIDAAIGIAIAAGAIAHAQEVGRLANTGLSVDDGLVSQAQASGARLSAVLATVFAVIGVAAAGFRVIRVGLALRRMGHLAPELSWTQRAAAAKAIAGDPALVQALGAMAPGDAAVGARLVAAVRAGGDAATMRAALRDVISYAAIPRRAASRADLYEPLRTITDGSDVSRIAAETGASRAEVEAAKRNLMYDEHILVDDQTGALYRGQFESLPDIANVWGRAARGERLAREQREFLRNLIRHEHAEGELLRAASGRTLEQAFFRGELEGKLRMFLKSQGWDEGKIAAMMANEPRPVTPYRYAHIVAHVSGARNP